MDAFEQHKYSEAAFFKLMLSNSVIVSYGIITAIDFDSVEVTLTVTNKNFSDKVNCTFMNLGNEQFSLSFKPAINMRVVVFSPNKGTNGMYDSFTQIKAKEGKGYIVTGSPAIYSSQQAFCFPLMKSTSQALSSLLVDNEIMTLEVAHELLATVDGVVNMYINDNTAIEFAETTEHFRDYFGNLSETFGMVEGISGAEKPGTYLYEETYGKFSTVKKNYESGMGIIIGKAYEKPFLENKGAITDSSAPVTINLGAKAPLTLTFGENVITIKADTENGLDIALTGAMKVNITAETGKLSFGNSTGTLKDVLDLIADTCATIATAGGPTAQTLNPAIATQFTGQIKTMIAGIFE